MDRSEVTPFFALSWVITWFSHDIDDFTTVERIFDFFLTSNPVMPLYFSAAVRKNKKKNNNNNKKLKQNKTKLKQN